MTPDRKAALARVATHHTPAARIAEDILSSILAHAARLVETFRLALTSPVTVGLSGGKDSLTAMLTLARLELKVIPLVVDMGYAGFDANAVLPRALRSGARAPPDFAGFADVLAPLTRLVVT